MVSAIFVKESKIRCFTSRNSTKHSKTTKRFSIRQPMCVIDNDQLRSNIRIISFHYLLECNSQKVWRKDSFFVVLCYQSLKTRSDSYFLLRTDNCDLNYLFLSKDLLYLLIIFYKQKNFFDSGFAKPNLEGIHASIQFMTYYFLMTNE